MIIMCIVLWACACAHRHARATMGKHAAYVSIESHSVFCPTSACDVYTDVRISRQTCIHACKYYVPGPPHHCLVPSHTTNNTGRSGSSISSSIIASDC